MAAPGRRHRDRGDRGRTDDAAAHARRFGRLCCIPIATSIRKVTIAGQYSGRNLLGGLHEAPGKSRYDCVLRSADAAIWVVNMRPKLRDSNNKEIELALDSRLDTSRWLEIRGTIHQSRGLLWLDAEAGSLKFAKPPQETLTEEEPIRVQVGPPPEVVFSTPTDDETDVLQSAFVRIQFSRDLDQKTLKGHVRARYLQVGKPWRARRTDHSWRRR